MKALCDIQEELKAPKGQTNKFGGYQYRSCEDILGAVKPILTKHKAVLTISDDVVQVLDRVYVKATATLTVDKESISVSAFAREALSKKGMDEAQVTGAASSYARKYALNGLFAIDDTKDADNDKPATVADQVDGCQNMNQLQHLWGQLSKTEQAANKELFATAKSKHQKLSLIHI